MASVTLLVWVGCVALVKSWGLVICQVDLEREQRMGRVGRDAIECT